MGDVDFVLDMPSARALGELDKVSRGIEGVNQKFGSTGGDLSEQMRLPKTLADLERVASALQRIGHLKASLGVGTGMGMVSGGLSFGGLSGPDADTLGRARARKVSEELTLFERRLMERTAEGARAAGAVGTTSTFVTGEAERVGRERGARLGKQMGEYESRLMRSYTEGQRIGPAGGTGYAALMARPTGERVAGGPTSFAALVAGGAAAQVARQMAPTAGGGGTSEALAVGLAANAIQDAMHMKVGGVAPGVAVPGKITGTSFVALGGDLTGEERGIAVEAGREAGRGIERKLTRFERELMKATAEPIRTRTGVSTSFSALMMAPEARKDPWQGFGMSRERAEEIHKLTQEAKKMPLGPAWTGLMPGTMRVGEIGGTGGLGVEGNEFRKQVGVAASGLGGLGLTLARTAAAGVALVGLPLSIMGAVAALKRLEEKGYQTGEAVSRREIAGLPLAAMAPGGVKAATQMAHEELGKVGIEAEQAMGLATKAHALYGKEPEKEREALRVMGQLRQIGVPEAATSQLMETAKAQGMRPGQMGGMVVQEAGKVGMTPAEYATQMAGASAFKKPAEAAGVLRGLKEQPGEAGVKISELGGMQETIGRLLNQQDTRFAKIMKQKITAYNKQMNTAWDWAGMGELQKLEAIRTLIGPENIQAPGASTGKGTRKLYGMSKEEAATVHRVIRPGHFEAMQAGVAETEGLEEDVLGQRFETMKEESPELRRAIAAQRADVELKEQYQATPFAMEQQKEGARGRIQAAEIQKYEVPGAGLIRAATLTPEGQLGPYIGRPFAWGMRKLQPRTDQEWGMSARAVGMEYLAEPKEPTQGTLPSGAGMAGPPGEPEEAKTEGEAEKAPPPEPPELGRMLRQLHRQGITGKPALEQVRAAEKREAESRAPVAVERREVPVAPGPGEERREVSSSPGPAEERRVERVPWEPESAGGGEPEGEGEGRGRVSGSESRVSGVGEQIEVREAMDGHGRTRTARTYAMPTAPVVMERPEVRAVPGPVAAARAMRREVPAAVAPVVREPVQGGFNAEAQGRGVAVRGTEPAAVARPVTREIPGAAGPVVVERAEVRAVPGPAVAARAMAREIPGAASPVVVERPEIRAVPEPAVAARAMTHMEPMPEGKTGVREPVQGGLNAGAQGRGVAVRGTETGIGMKRPGEPVGRREASPMAEWSAEWRREMALEATPRLPDELIYNPPWLPQREKLESGAELRARQRAGRGEGAEGMRIMGGMGVMGRGIGRGGLLRASGKMRKLDAATGEETMLHGEMGGKATFEGGVLKASGKMRKLDAATGEETMLHGEMGGKATFEGGVLRASGKMRKADAATGEETMLHGEMGGKATFEGGVLKASGKMRKLDAATGEETMLHGEMGGKATFEGGVLKASGKMRKLDAATGEETMLHGEMGSTKTFEGGVLKASGKMRKADLGTGEETALHGESGAEMTFQGGVLKAAGKAVRKGDLMHGEGGAISRMEGGVLKASGTAVREGELAHGARRMTDEEIASAGWGEGGAGVGAAPGPVQGGNLGGGINAESLRRGVAEESKPGRVGTAPGGAGGEEKSGMVKLLEGALKELVSALKENTAAARQGKGGGGVGAPAMGGGGANYQAAPLRARNAHS